MKKNKSALLIGLVSILMSNWSLAEIIDEEPEVSKKPKTNVSTDSAQSNLPTKEAKEPVKVQVPSKPKVAPSSPALGTKVEASVKKSPSKSTSEQKERLPVHFESKGLKGLREKGMVELIEDVIVTQGDLRLEAANAKVFFAEATQEVQKVIAEGQVKITNIDETTGEKMEAFGNQALFNNLEHKVILEGNARLKRGDSSVIRGKKITYELNTGWIKADKVAGELAPGEKDSIKK